MINTAARILCGSCLALATCANTPQHPSYLHRFMDYLAWSKQLPNASNTDFIEFISDSNAPLSRKLREKWLYQLAKNNDWETYSSYYQDSTNISLQCYAQFSRHQLWRATYSSRQYPSPGK